MLVLCQIGNFIEPVLVEIRDIKYIFAAAKSKRWVQILRDAAVFVTKNIYYSKTPTYRASRWKGFWPGISGGPVN